MALRRRLVWFVLFALLAAQTLGLVHRIAHGSIAPESATFVSQSQGHWADGLQPGHADDTTCHVFDQASQGGCLWALPASLPAMALPLFIVTLAQGEAQARWAALFDARGPPSVR